MTKRKHEGGNIRKPDEKEAAERDETSEKIKREKLTGLVGDRPVPSSDISSNWRRRKA